MNVLFLTIGRMKNIEDRGIYPDLLRCFRNKGHNVYIVAPYEKRMGLKTELIESSGVHLLHVSVGNITKCGMIEKGISTLRIESQFIAAIKKYFCDVKFDLIMYSTPPITFAKVVKYIKKRDRARSYLLLKDIFPQNAVDIGLMAKHGIKGIIYRYFRTKEKQLYSQSDYIGCMSSANCEYLLEHNPELSSDCVEVCPNSIEFRDLSLNESERQAMRDKYGLPKEKKIFVYGGNLGKPQGIPFIIECLKSVECYSDAYFLIVGDGTEYRKLESYINESNPQNVRLMNRLEKEDYDRMIASCDVGLVFLDHRFTIPNFPSRLLAYMQASLPVLACTDPNTDIGEVITSGGFGWWCESNDTAAFASCIKTALQADRAAMQQREIEYLREHYTVEKSYEVIIKNYFKGLS